MKKLLIGLTLLASMSSFASEKPYFSSCFCEMRVNHYVLKGLKIIDGEVEITDLAKGSARIDMEYTRCKQSKSDLIVNNICPSEEE